MAEPEIRFCTSADGTRIAYAAMGQGPPLVVAPGWGYPLEADWKLPEAMACLEALAQKRTVVRFDHRGVGASQRDVGDVSLESQVADMAAVSDQLHLEQFDVFGFSDGALVGIIYAAQHPGRTARLVLWAPYARGADIAPTGAFRAVIELIRGTWVLASRAMADLVFPSGPDQLLRWFSNSLRHSVSPEVAVKHTESRASADVRTYLTQIKVPTLVFHRRGDQNVPFAAGRTTAALIPNARFVALEGDISYPFCGDTSYMAIMMRFLDEDRVKDEPVRAYSASGLVTVLFTDIVGHTEMMQRLGDDAGRAVLREHERMVREVLAEHRGVEVKTMGDGFMASFGSVTKAVECAIALQRAFGAWNKEQGTGNKAPPHPLSIRVGLNAGEPIAEEGDLFGASVILAARIAAEAGPGEVLVPDTVRGLLAGKGFLFADRGDVALRGFEDPVRLFEVRWRE